MMAMAATVLCKLKGGGGITAVVMPTWTACIIMENILETLTVFTGRRGKGITTQSWEQKWRSDQKSFKGVLVAAFLLI